MDRVGRRLSLGRAGCLFHRPTRSMGLFFHLSRWRMYCITTGDFSDQRPCWQIPDMVAPASAASVAPPARRPCAE